MRGAGDLASGVALRLHRSGLDVVLCELPAPLAVRRLVSFSEAVYQGACTVEEVTALRVPDPADRAEIGAILARREIPVVVDPHGILLDSPEIAVIVDARMLKAYPLAPQRGAANPAALLIGLGPGFEAGQNCDAIIETRRGHTLGRVLWSGRAEADTGQPEAVLSQGTSRVLRAPADGVLENGMALGSLVNAGMVICRVGGQPVRAAFDGALRGLLRDGSPVTAGLKIGDLDPRLDPALCYLVSDKSLAIGGGVLEAILSRPALRQTLFRPSSRADG